VRAAGVGKLGIEPLRLRAAASELQALGTLQLRLLAPQYTRPGLGLRKRRLGLIVDTRRDPQPPALESRELCDRRPCRELFRRGQGRVRLNEEAQVLQPL